MSKLINITIISIIMIFILSINVYAYENEIFKIDIPSNYGTLDYSGITVFANTESECGIIIYAQESVGLKKDLSTMSESEIEEIIDHLSGDLTILEQGKEKLGKSKSIKVRVYDDENYMDMYIVVSDKHVLVIGFMAPTESELENTEFVQIKKSFKMKEKTTNVTLIRLLIFGVIIASVVISYKSKNRKNKKYDIDFNLNNDY